MRTWLVINGWNGIVLGLVSALTEMEAESEAALLGYAKDVYFLSQVFWPARLARHDLTGW